MGSYAVEYANVRMVLHVTPSLVHAAAHMDG